MKKSISAEICKKCAACCKHFPFVQVSEHEITSLEKHTELHSEVFTNEKSEGGEEYFLQFQENGDCFFLVEKEGSYSCGVYEARPGICKKYPAEAIQKKVCRANMGKFCREKV